MHRISTALLLSVLLLGAACGGDDDKVSTGGATSTSSTTTGVGGDDAGGGEGGTGDGGTAVSAGGGTATTKPAGATGNTSAQAPAPAPSASNAAKPAAAGRYTYDVEGTATQSGPLGGTEALPTPATLTVDPADGGRQRSVLDSRSAEGEGSVTTTVLLFRDDGVYLESLRLQTRASGVTITYDFVPSPPQLVSPTGVDVGFHTEFSMTSTNGGLKTTTTIDVLAKETVTVGGASVETFKVRTHTRVTGDAEGESTSTANIDPTSTLSVTSHTVSDLDTAFGRFKSDGRSRLRSLSPA